MKKGLSMLLTLVMVLSLLTLIPMSVWAEDAPAEQPPDVPEVVTYSSNVNAETYAPAGDGSEENPYQIATADDLLWMARKHAWGDASTKISDHNGADIKEACINPFKGKFFIQTADIDLGGKVLPSIGLINNSPNPPPIPMTKQHSAFGGTYDGQGHSISNGYTSRLNPLKEELTLVSMSVPRGGFGLFGVINGATIKNLNLKNFKLYTDNKQYIACAGLLVGIAVGGQDDAKDYNLIENCTTDADCAISYTGGTDKLYADGYGHFGGLVGLSTQITIRNCVNNANITVGHAIGNIGGIAGVLSGGVIENCENNGKISIVNAATVTVMNKDRFRKIGGILGGMQKTDMVSYSTKIDGCINRGDITNDVPAVSAYAAGGIFGGSDRANTMKLTISNCVNLGKIEMSAAENVPQTDGSNKNIPFAEGAIAGAIKIASSDRENYPQTIDMRMFNISSIPLHDLAYTMEVGSFPGCHGETISVKMENDAETIACNWFNLGEKDVNDIKDNHQKVLEACLTAENYKIGTAEELEANYAGLRKTATVYGVQKSNDNKTSLRVLARINNDQAVCVGVELVDLAGNTVVASAVTQSLYTSVVANGKTVFAGEEMYFAVLVLDCSGLADEHDLRIYTMDADGNKIYHTSTTVLAFKRGELKTN